MKLLKIVGPALLALLLPSCFTVEHFPGDASRYDRLYFGPVSESPMTPPVKADRWRNYAVFGLVEWSEDQIQWAGARLGGIGEAQRPMKIAVHTEQSVPNGLTSFGLGLIGGIFAPLLFVPRTTAVLAW